MRGVAGSLEPCLALHFWRQSYNGNSIGFGLDEYQSERSFHYPEAYAYWGRGYLLLYLATRESKWLQMARVAADWLIENRNVHYKSASWGLPWSFPGKDVPETLSYLVTTAAVAEFLAHLGQVTEEERYLLVALSAALWMTTENGGGKAPSGAWLNYAPHPSLSYPIFNAVAMAVRALFAVSRATGEKEYWNFALEMVRYLFAEQNRNGSWSYSTRSSVVDNVHTGYTLTGLLAGYRLYPLRWRVALWSGADFYWTNLFLPNGTGLLRLLESPFTWRKVPWRRWLRDQGARFYGTRLERVGEARLWGYATALNFFVLASHYDEKWEQPATQIFQYIQRHHRGVDGSYAYRPDERVPYIRHQAHVFAAMAAHVNTVQQLSSRPLEYSYLPRGGS